jgi:glycerophosphoryl diester phosphodiesterase
MQPFMSKNWLRIAHRGASGSAPEHTRAAFMRALDIGVDMIELDVQLSRDEELVVVHDFELERTTNGRGPVRSHDWADLKTLDAGSWFAAEFAGQRMLTLSEVVDIVDERARLNVEVKPTAGDERILADKLVGLLERRGKLASTVVSCFDFDVLREIRSADEKLKIGLLTHDPDFTRVWRVARELEARSVHPHWALLTPEVLSRARDEGLEVLVWTVNEIDIMSALVDQGVDGIISDYPERFSKVGRTSNG